MLSLPQYQSTLAPLSQRNSFEYLLDVSKRSFYRVLVPLDQWEREVQRLESQQYFSPPYLHEIHQAANLLLTQGMQRSLCHSCQVDFEPL
ncbi:hypothetical protein EMIT0373P_30816 [Pseudomonas chlororaphis]